MRRNRTKSKLAKEMSRTHEKCKYVPTKDEIMYWFNIINREIFKNDLPQFRKIEVRRRHGCWGECIGDTHKKTGRYSDLSLNHYQKSKKHFIETLIHEMVHHYQWIHENTMTHGETFFAWKPKLAKYNVTLTA